MLFRSQIILEITKCTLLIILSTFLFAQSSLFAIKLGNFTANILSQKNITISNNILDMYVKHSEGYIDSDNYEKENIKSILSNNTFTKLKKYNDKYITSSNWTLPDEKEYKYSINWIMATIVGAFFLYSLFFSGMMLAKRQIEFLFLFVISPIVFACSVGNKQRRSTLYELLTSLILQGAVIMLIIALTSLVIEQINLTTFFLDFLLITLLV